MKALITFYRTPPSLPHPSHHFCAAFLRLRIPLFRDAYSGRAPGFEGGAARLNLADHPMPPVAPFYLGGRAFLADRIAQHADPLDLGFQHVDGAIRMGEAVAARIL